VALFAAAGPGGGVALSPAAPLELGGSAPVRAELALGAPPDEPEAAAWQLADSLLQRREIACEGLRFEIADEAALGRAREFGEALARHGLSCPLVLRMPAALAALAKDVGARWVIPVGVGSDPAQLLAAACGAVATGVAVEWAIEAAADAAPAALAAGLAQALAASREAALTRVLISVESSRPVPAVRFVAAELRARGEAVPIVLVHRDEAAASDDDALLHASIDLGAPLCDGMATPSCCRCAATGVGPATHSRWPTGSSRARGSARPGPSSSRAPRAAARSSTSRRRRRASRREPST
jgi:hypothetical protein